MISVLDKPDPMRVLLRHARPGMFVVFLATLPVGELPRREVTPDNEQTKVHAIAAKQRTSATTVLPRGRVKTLLLGLKRGRSMALLAASGRGEPRVSLV